MDLCVHHSVALFLWSKAEQCNECRVLRIQKSAGVVNSFHNFLQALFSETMPEMTENETPTKKQHRWVSVGKWLFCGSVVCSHVAVTKFLAKSLAVRVLTRSSEGWPGLIQKLGNCGCKTPFLSFPVYAKLFVEDMSTWATWATEMLWLLHRLLQCVSNCVTTLVRVQPVLLRRLLVDIEGVTILILTE